MSKKTIIIALAIYLATTLHVFAADPASDPSGTSTPGAGAAPAGAGDPLRYDDASKMKINVREELSTDTQNQDYLDTQGAQAPIEKLIIRVINYMLAIIGSIAFLLIVIAGVMIVTSPGNEPQRTQANEMILSSIIGLVIAFSAYVIVNFVQGLFY